MTEDDKLRAFIRTHTELIPPPACPELRLHTATALTPLWQASEAFLSGNNLPPPYWAFAWAGGQALARHVLDSPWLVRGRKVLDFAAGSGIAGVAAALAGAKSVLSAEVDLVAVQAIALNAEANDVAVEVRAADLTGTSDEGWEVVLAGDVCYERAMTDQCYPWLRGLAARGAMVLLADPGRAFLPQNGLVRLAEYDIPTSREIEDRDLRKTAIYRVAEK